MSFYVCRYISQVICSGSRYDILVSVLCLVLPFEGLSIDSRNSLADASEGNSSRGEEEKEKEVGGC